MKMTARAQMAKAIEWAEHGHKDMAARTIATLHRAANAKDQAFLVSVATEYKLAVRYENGCMLAVD